MAFQLENELASMNHCWGIYEQNRIVNSVRGEDWTAELAIITSTLTVHFKNLRLSCILSRCVLRYDFHPRVHCPRTVSHHLLHCGQVHWSLLSTFDSENGTWTVNYQGCECTFGQLISCLTILRAFSLTILRTFSLMWVSYSWILFFQPKFQFVLYNRSCLMVLDKSAASPMTGSTELQPEMKWILMGMWKATAKRGIGVFPKWNRNSANSGNMNQLIQRIHEIW